MRKFSNEDQAKAVGKLRAINFQLNRFGNSLTGEELTKKQEEHVIDLFNNMSKYRVILANSLK